MRITVECTDDEREKLRKHPAISQAEQTRLSEVLKDGLEVMRDDFYAHMALLDACAPGANTTPEELGEWAAAGRPLWEKYLPIDDSGLKVVRLPVGDITQRAGEAAATILGEYIFRTTVADYTRVPEFKGRSAKGKKTFDFRAESVAVLNDRVLQIEAKGTALDASCDTMASSIRAKKREPFVQSSAPTGKGVFIGAVLDVGSTCDATRIVLVDPPLDPSEPWDLAELKYLKRSFFYLNLFRACWRGHVAVALANRLRLMVDGALRFSEANSIPLVRADQEPLYPADEFGSMTVRTLDGSIHGRVFEHDDHALFLGFHRRVVTTIVAQDHSSLLELAFAPTILSVDLRSDDESAFKGHAWLTSAGAVVGSMKKKRKAATG